MQAQLAQQSSQALTVLQGLVDPAASPSVEEALGTLSTVEALAGGSATTSALATQALEARRLGAGRQEWDAGWNAGGWDGGLECGVEMRWVTEPGR